MLIKIILAYLIIINAAAFVLMLVDKQKARRGSWRIPEARLMGIAALGGSIGAITGMYLFRHKTKHPKFYIGLPLILAAQVIAATILVILFA